MAAPYGRAGLSALVTLLFVFQATCALPSGEPAGGPGPLRAEAGDLGAQDSVCPIWEDNSSQVDLLSQNLTVALYPDTHRISAEGELRFRSNWNSSQVSLWLHNNLNITRFEEDGQALNYSRSAGSDMITVTFDPKLQKGRVLTLNVSYEGMMWVLEDGLRQDCVGWEGAYVKGSTHWYIMHHTSDWADYRLKLCCPPNWTAVADGELVDEERSAGWANYTWVTDRPCMRPAFAAGNYSLLNKASGGVNITAWTYPEDAASGQRYVDEAAAVLSSYSQMLGPYERKSFKIVETEHQTMTGYACSGFVMLYPGAFKGSGINYNLLSHETGHEWFPFATGYTGWAYPWLWEAFPEYLSCIYQMEKYGVRDRLDQDRNAFVQIHDDARQKCIRATNWDDPLSYPVVYAKGAWVVHMLRGMLGDTGFFSTLKDYVAENRYAMGSVEIFIATASRHSPFPLDDFFQQWLNTTKALDVSLTVARQYENGTSFYLELEPANLQCATNPADIGIEYDDATGQTVRLGWNGTARLVCLPARSSVYKVRLDPDGWLLDIDRGNEAAAPVQSGKIFDLQLLSVNAPQDIAEGQEVRVEAEVRNNSSYEAKVVRVDFFVDGSPLGSQSVNISERSTGLAGIAWIPVRGCHTLSARVDPDGKYHEWDEANNNGSLAVEVAPPLPKLDLELTGLIASPANPMEGAPMTFSAIVKNIGEAAVGNFSVEFFVDNLSVKSLTVAKLDARASRNLTAAWVALRGQHNLSAVADPHGLIEETAKINNRAEMPFFVDWPLGIQLTAAPQEPFTLEPVTFSVGGNGSEFAFDFGDGGSLCWTAERNVTHEYRDDGNYHVVARGRAAGMEEDASISLRILDRPPEVSVRADPASPLSLVPVTFSAKALDRDGEIASVVWSFGDGSASEGNRVEHVFARPGDYPVCCTAIDDDGTRNSTSLPLKVLNRPPGIGWEGVARALPGQLLTFSANATDPDGCMTFCRWDFGDGRQADGAVVQHRYERSGKYNIILEVRDDFGDSANRTCQLRVAQADHPAAPGWDFLPAAAIYLALLILGAALAWWWNRRKQQKKQHEDFFIDKGQNQ